MSVSLSHSLTALTSLSLIDDSDAEFVDDALPVRVAVDDNKVLGVGVPLGEFDGVPEADGEFDGVMEAVDVKEVLAVGVIDPVADGDSLGELEADGGTKLADALVDGVFDDDDECDNDAVGEFDGEFDTDLVDDGV